MGAQLVIAMLRGCLGERLYGHLKNEKGAGFQFPLDRQNAASSLEGHLIQL
jgi:hypothetical protein